MAPHWAPALTKASWNNSPIACKGLQDDTQGGYSCPTGVLPYPPLEEPSKPPGMQVQEIKWNLLGFILVEVWKMVLMEAVWPQAISLSLSCISITGD